MVQEIQVKDDKIQILRQYSKTKVLFTKLMRKIMKVRHSFKHQRRISKFRIKSKDLKITNYSLLIQKLYNENCKLRARIKDFNSELDHKIEKAYNHILAKKNP